MGSTTRGGVLCVVDRTYLKAVKSVNILMQFKINITQPYVFYF
jgi:hypothetical protein